MIKLILSLFKKPNFADSHLIGAERNSYLLNTDFNVESDYIKQKRKECYQKFGDDKFLSRNNRLRITL